MIGRQALIAKTYKHEKMTTNEEDGGVLGLKDDEHSLEFTFD